MPIIFIALVMFSPAFLTSGEGPGVAYKEKRSIYF